MQAKEGNMYIKILIIGLMLAFGTLIGVMHSLENTPEIDNLAKLYEYGLVKKIEKCESQADLLHTSASETLRNQADLHDKKAEFLDSEREILVNTMIERRLEPKQYKIEHFLEVQFYRSLAR